MTENDRIKFLRRKSQIETSCDRNSPELSSVDQKVFVTARWLVSDSWSGFLFLLIIDYRTYTEQNFKIHLLNTLYIAMSIQFKSGVKLKWD